MYNEVIEAADIFKTTQILQKINLMAKTTYFDVFKFIYFLNRLLKFQWNLTLPQN